MHGKNNEKSTDGKKKWQFPVHSALSDKEWSESSVQRMLRSVHAANPALLNQPDEEGIRPISLAAIEENLAAVSILLELAAPELARGNDVLGLEDSDNIHETAMSRNLALLRQTPRFLMHEMLEGASKTLREGYIKNKLPKCICGRCTAGWLSPRMRFRLRQIAHEAYTAMLSRLDDFDDGDPLDAEAASEDPFLIFLPPQIVAQGILKPFYMGYRSAFHVIRKMLSIPDAAPTAALLRVELASGAREAHYNYAAVEYFVARGGSVKYALDYVLHQALWTSPMPLGDGSFDRKWDAILPFPDPRISSHSRVGHTVQSPPHSKSPRIGSSPLLGVPVHNSPNPNGGELQAHPRDMSPKPQTRRRSSSVKEFLFGRKDRQSCTIEIANDDCFNHAREWKLKDDWDESGAQACPLDTQFRGVRYLMGLHTLPKWEVAEVDSEANCELKTTTARS